MDVVVVAGNGRGYMLVDASKAWEYAAKGLRMHCLNSPEAVKALLFPLLGNRAKVMPALRAHLSTTIGERANQLIEVAVIDEVTRRIVNHQTAVFDAPLGSLRADTQRALDQRAEAMMLALDIAGIFDPTPASDLASAALALQQGDNFAVSLSILSATVPFVGDAVAKPIKLVRAAFRRLKELVPKGPLRVVSKGSEAAHLNPITTQLMERMGLTRDTVLYRTQNPKYLDMETKTVAGNPKSMALVQDPYASHWPNQMVDMHRKEGVTEIPEWVGNRGRSTNASELGPTLNVAVKNPAAYAKPGQVTFGVKLGDVLDQGGRIFIDTGAAVQGINPLILTIPERVPFHLVK